MSILKRLSRMLCLCALLAIGTGADSALAQCTSLYTFNGEAAYDAFGCSVSDADDVNNDGYADVIVGAYSNDAGGNFAGRVYIYSGQTGLSLWTLTAEAPQDNFGWSVSGAGDVDNDGYADVIVGAPLHNTGGLRAGRAYVYSGQTGTLLWTFTGDTMNDYFGFAVSGAGDVNNDGHADLIVGVRRQDPYARDEGRAFVYSGQTGALLWTFTGEGVDDQFGVSVSDAGDVDGDGFGDVIIGAPDNDAAGSDAGRAYVYSGQAGALIWTFTGEARSDELGASVSSAGDVDNDGFDDVIVGAPWNDAGGHRAGRAYVYSGQTGELIWTFTGSGEWDDFGRSVSGAGDADEDGYPDLIIGAPRNSAGGYQAGRAYVYSGQTGSLLWRFTGEAPDDRFGESVSGAGDIDADGKADFIVGAVGADVGGLTSGRAYVYAACIPLPPPGSIAGRVSAGCPSVGSGLYGVMVDVFEIGTGYFAGSTLTDADGNYQIDDLTPGGYMVSIVTPLGYTTTAEEVAVDVPSGATVTANFLLECVETVGNPRMFGFWKHQFGAAVSGHGNAQIEAETLCSYLDLIENHFNSNEINQVVVYHPCTPIPPGTCTCMDNLYQASQLLNLRGNTHIANRAKQQLMAVLLNVASERILLSDIISDDGATLSQAITYCDSLIDDNMGDHQVAWAISRKLSASQKVAAGEIPLTTPDIAYRTAIVPGGFALNQNFPNPFNPATEISFSLPKPSHARIDVFNILGQTVATLIDRHMPAGEHSITWDADGASSGVYFYRLTADQAVETKRMLLLK